MEAAYNSNLIELLKGGEIQELKQVIFIEWDYSTGIKLAPTSASACMWKVTVSIPQHPQLKVLNWNVM